ncbi:zinc finger protein SNAI3 isoform X1 [Loxodonta africana]|uniref:zinc finger protein SNAI3 isoform X1 n=1 Tax=Loxodonta africana TaxID=9785 RepID=UPI0030D0B45C
MPRSFLVKTHSSHRIPNYGQLETQREANGSCSTCRGLVVPLLLPDKEAPSTLSDTPRPQNCTPVISCLALPLPRDEEVRGALSPRPLEVSLLDPGAGRAPSAPLRDSLNHLNLPPLLVLHARWPPILGPGGGKSPEKLCGTAGTPRPPGCFECLDCHRPYHTVAGLARHRQLHCDLQPRRCFSCKHCDKEYASLGALKMHLRTHTLPCVCVLCGKAFSRPWLLQGHIRTHTVATYAFCNGRLLTPRSWPCAWRALSHPGGGERQVRSPTPAHTAAGPSLTALTSGHTCRRTQMSRGTSARDAPRPSPVCHSWHATKNRAAAPAPECWPVSTGGEKRTEMGA